MKYDLRPMGIGEMLDRGLKIYLSNLPPLLTVSLVIMVPLGLFTAWMQSVAAESGGFQGGAVAVNLLATVVIQGLLQGALIQAVSDIYLGGKTGAGSVLARAAGRIVPLLLAAFLTGICIGFGFLLLIVGAFIAVAGLCVTQCAVMLEKRGGMESLGRSWSLTKDHRSRAFSTLFAAGLITGILNFAVVFAITLLHPGPFLLQLGTTLFSALTQPFAVVVTILLYYDLRIRKEAFDLQVLAKEMGSTTASAPTP